MKILPQSKKISQMRNATEKTRETECGARDQDQERTRTTYQSFQMDMKQKQQHGVDCRAERALTLGERQHFTHYRYRRMRTKDASKL